MNRTTPEKNPFMSGDIGLRELVENLSRNRPGGLPGQFPGFEPQRLQALIEQAENVRDSATAALKTIGTLSVNAAQLNKNAASVDWCDVGYLTQWLADVVAMCNLLASNARFTLADPEEANKIAMASAGIHPDRPRTTN